MRRRNFLATLPAVAMTVQPLGDLVAAAMAQPVPPPRRVGLEQVEQVWEMARQANVLDHRYGSGLVNEMLAGQVRWAVGLFNAYVDRGAEPELHSAVGHLCTKAAWAAHDSGLADSAWHYFSAALRCAEQADDWNLRCRVLGLLSKVAAEAGHGDDALTFAEQAALRADRLSGRRRAMIALYQAHALALVMNREASLAAIGRAEDEFAAADPADDLSSHGTEAPLDVAELHANCGLTMDLLTLYGHPLDAAPARLREAIATYPDAYARSRALAATELATILMRNGDVTEAVHYGNQALDAAGTMHSARLTASIRTLHRAASNQRRMPEVDALRQRTAHTLAS